NLSKTISQRVPPKAIVFGFEPRITTYLSGRNVFHPAEVLHGMRQNQWLAALRKSKVSWIFYQKANAKRDGSTLVTKLLRTHAIVLVPTSETTTNGVVLARLTISDRLDRPRPTTRPTTKSTTRR